MSIRLERLYLTAVLSGWWLDWQRYYAAEEAERQARLSLTGNAHKPANGEKS